MVVFITTVFAAFLFQCCSKAFAYPPTNPHDLNVARRATPLLSPSPSLFNASTPTIHPNVVLECFPEGNIRTSLAGCRPTLNYIRTFPSYRTRQLFKMGRSPRLPVRPPTIIYDENADCAVEVACAEPFHEDMFSWEQVRAAATTVAADCEENYGYGGRTVVGQGVGWNVRVLGFKDDAGGVNGTVVGEEVDGTASTVLVADS